MSDDTKTEETPGDEAAAAPAASEPEQAAESADSPESAESPADSAAAEEPAAAKDGAAAKAPEHTYHELHEMNVAQLREVAAKIEHEAVHGYSTMHKEHLVPAICAALGIEPHEHHEVVGIDKESVKARIRELKKQRDEAEAAGDKVRLKLTRRRIRGLKRKIRKATI